MIKPNEEEESFNIEQVSFILKENMLISFQEYEGDPFDNIRDRIRTAKGKARPAGSLRRRLHWATMTSLLIGILLKEHLRLLNYS